MKTKLITYEGSAAAWEQMLIECPGCKQSHILTINNPLGGPQWTFNGEMENPTFSPSLLVTSYEGPEHIEIRCHSFIRDGKIQFLEDCTHELKGQTVELPDIAE